MTKMKACLSVTKSRDTHLDQIKKNIYNLRISRLAELEGFQALYWAQEEISFNILCHSEVVKD